MLPVWHFGFGANVWRSFSSRGGAVHRHGLSWPRCQHGAGHLSKNPASNRSASGELALRTFGPLADALGTELARLPPFASRNLQRLALVFSRKSEPGDEEMVSPRLFKQVVDEAAWADDEIIAEYLGGVLASSAKAPVSDTGVVVAQLIRRLSSAQLRAHFLIYSGLRRLREPIPVLDLSLAVNQSELHLELDYVSFFEHMKESTSSLHDHRGLLQHVILGLAREELVDDVSWNYSRTMASAPDGDDGHTEEPLAVHPSPLGAELFLWGMGSPVIDQARLFDPGLELVYPDDIGPLVGSRLGRHVDSDDVGHFDRLFRNSEFRRIVEELTARVGTSSDSVPLIVQLAVAHAVIGESERAAQLAAHAGGRSTAEVGDEILRGLDRYMIQRPQFFEELLRVAATFARAYSPASDV